MDVDRGQAHTIEAFSAGIVLLASVLFALQVTAVTPLTASTASQHIENQQRGVGGGVLDQAAERGTLKETALYWNGSTGGANFHNITNDNSNAYTSGAPPTEFGETLNETFLDRGIAFDLTFYTVDSPGQVKSTKVVDLGTPSENAVTVRRTITLYDDDELYHANHSVNEGMDVSSASFYADDRAPGNGFFNVINVELTLWRM